MKFILTLVICSYGVCGPAFEWPYPFKTYHECAIFGYEAAAARLKDMDPMVIDKNKTTILFTCREMQQI